MSVYLYVTGNDFSALDFERKFDVEKFYQKMIKEGVTEKTINKKNYYIEVYIKEFGEVDEEFEYFIKNELCDYDGLKATNIYKVS